MAYPIKGLSCEKRFTTYERVELQELTIIKKDGRREQFDRDKILKGLKRACEKRPIGLEVLSKIVDEIEVDLRSYDNIEVASSVVGNLVMDNLMLLDAIAYIRFASVYREFKDVTDIKKVLKKLKEDKVE